ncbi:radical SAM protein [Riemerella anatipestifer]|uniref:radical SAM/SPASM domain-containing protein n=1 Tax=Riemerella anatipestifer TaxID=34085 RepID=UPI00129D47CB|nr:radical SAM protein [Riemerella anatipestifer]MRN00435.1 radical SAM protein [Riemerella anatipestifer]MRN02556.1 radical SAM protein [Riemerella anatipestifer]
MFKQSKYLIKSEVPLQEGNDLEDEQKVILFSTRTGGTLVVKKKLLKLLEEREWSKISNYELQKLIENKVIICEDEEDSIIAFNIADNTANKSLSMTIQLTANCQLGCFYCGQVHSPNKASKKVVNESIKRVIDKLEKGKYEALHITWYGGEPLLVVDDIVNYSYKILSFCAKNNIEYTSDIITNGLLLKENTFEKLVGVGITQYQVTLDGNKDTHDKRRITKKGGKSYEIIKRNIVEIVKSNLYKKSNSRLNMRINVDKTVAHGISSLIDEIYQEGILNDINVTFAPVFDWGGNEADKNSFTPQDFADMEIEWLLKLLELGKKDINLIPKVRTSSCMVDNIDSEVHDAFGNIYACYEYTYTPAYSDKSFLEGNLLNLEKGGRKLSPIRNFKNDILNRTHSNCIECIFFPVCSGECPKQWMNGKVPCPSFKFNMGERLLLEYLIKKLY